VSEKDHDRLSFKNREQRADAADVEIELRASAATTGPLVEASPELIAARAEFDQLILDLCSAESSRQQPDTWFARFLEGRAVKRANRVITKYQELRLALLLFENHEYWQASRDGLKALKVNNVGLSEGIVGSLSLHISKSASLSSVIIGIVCYLFLGMGLVSAYLSISPLRFIFDPQDFFVGIRKFLDKPTVMDATFAAAMFGGLGSVVSLLLRIGSFEAVRGRSSLYLLLFGLVQPIIGLIIGGVVGAALAAHLINVSFQHTAEDAPVNVYFVAVVGFLCGFSERVAKTALATAGRAVGIEEEQPPTQHQAIGGVGGAIAKVSVPPSKIGTTVES
jgi:hypothetical protein